MDSAAWSAWFDQILHSPNFPMWATVAVAAFVALLVLITLLRADKSVANGALVAITIGAIGLAGYSAFRGFGSSGSSQASGEARDPIAKAMPALACVDDLAGDMVLAACEKALFSSPETVAAAVSYASARLARLTALGDVAAADKQMTPELTRLRRAIERDRYGLIAYVLSSQDRCQPTDCAAFRSLTDSSRIAANIGDHLYETTLTRYAPSWGGLPMTAVAGSVPAAAATLPVPGTPALTGVTEAPSGKPTDIDFPTSASIPPVSIMTEPTPAKPAAAAATNAKSAPAAKKPPAPPAAAQASATHNAAGAAAANPPPAKRPPAPPKPKPPAPVQLAPEEAPAEN
ncbi:hypothetical protein I8G32_03248 [Rhodopseudomonas palustris]|uniref:Uncharacterized protein n=1 Tax=Rhodopseudomonas palustris (strain ATCC BAA-98 / CGA009) TaxID=258594 RepID=Q6N526_RHOPA|nr:hypothetical protein [Rhodopseudomonas palustris]OPF93735.1 hypothetical protein B1S06_11190 [Rhodopseudomonas palustris]QQM04690.1 hypothetical protein I8G32_03248 [Rhodopseudomonas palustris]RJF66360.1 hypothetical protein D4Q71_05920 [Rhodopseudomonas palustris]WAB76064.1 hypothetical protein OR798_16325 [Rhodopseudomonas palustris]WCL93322.1 hypothetical protein TX73_016320 [Rhodopseudomonas palustris CGA009]